MLIDNSLSVALLNNTFVDNNNYENIPTYHLPFICN